MTANRNITVTEWSEPKNTIFTEKRAPRRFWSPSVIGLIGTLFLHSLALQTVVMGNRAQKIDSPGIQRLGGSLNKFDAKPADALVFVDLPTTAKTTDDVYALASVLEAIKDAPIAAAHPDPSPPLDVVTFALSDDNELTSADSGDGADRARLLGIYSGQIQARVDRAWRRPRTPVNEGTSLGKAASTEYFQCQVQVVQDSNGNVQEILLPNCNGSGAWQRSLVLAIQQASPLPAPPNPNVFSRTLTLIRRVWISTFGNRQSVEHAQHHDVRLRASGIPTYIQRRGFGITSFDV